MFEINTVTLTDLVVIGEGDDGRADAQNHRRMNLAVSVRVAVRIVPPGLSTVSSLCHSFVSSLMLNHSKVNELTHSLTLMNQQINSLTGK